MTHTSLIRLSTVGLLVVAMAACAPRPQPEPIVPDQSGSGQQQGGTGAPVGPVNPGSGMGAATPGSVQDFVVNVGDRIYFDLDSYQVRPEAGPRLDAQAQWLLRYPNVTVRIEGNADERGTREYNLALGARRAESVRNYLIQRGVPAGRIDTISFGKERPIATGSNEEAWARNRNAGTAIVSGAPR
jgi:peptidoglycan-associated lipoprotein